MDNLEMRFKKSKTQSLLHLRHCEVRSGEAIQGIPRPEIRDFHHPVKKEGKTNLPKARLWRASKRVPYSLIYLVTSKKAAFTLAEVLITLGIIGIVAAMTIPTLIDNYEKKQTITKLKKAYSVLSQAVLRSVSDNGPISGYLTSGDIVSSTKTEEFFNTYWLPYFNVKEIAENNNTTLYSSISPYKTLTGANCALWIYTKYNAGRVLLRTSDDIIYFIHIMSWDYEYDEKGNILNMTALYSSQQNIYVDLNGTSGPNTLGKDVFRFIADFDKNTIRAYGSDRTKSTINSDCSSNGNGYRCAAKIINDGWQISDDYPW